MAEIRIRPFTTADQPAVRALVLAGLGEHFGFVDDTRNPDLDAIHEAYVERGGLVLVAERNSSIVGTGTLAIEGQEVGRIVRMSVAPSARGQGLGRRLVDELLAEARRRGYRQVVVETCDDWDDAIGLYLRCGFREIDRRDGDIHFSLDLAG